MKKFLGAACIIVLGGAVAACVSDTRGTPMGGGPSQYTFLGESLGGTTGLGVYVDHVELEISLFGIAGTRVRSLGGSLEFPQELGTLADPVWEYSRVCDSPIDIACGNLTALMNDGTAMPMVIESVAISKASDATFTATFTGYVFNAGVRGEAIEVVGSGRMTGSCRELVDGTVSDLPITARPECAAILGGL